MFPSFSSPTRAAPPGRLPAAIAVLVLILAACSGTAAPSTSPSAALASATPVATPAPTPSPSVAPAYPASLTDDEGTAVTIPAAPQKIVSLTPATTEILFALGAGDRVVAADDGSDFPTEAVALPHVATFSSVDTEKVIAAGADLVIAGGLGFTPTDAITKLRSLGIPVLGRLRAVGRGRSQGHRHDRNGDRDVR